MWLKWIAVVAVLALPTMASAQEEARRITVVGEGRVTVEPDMATITLGVVSDGSSAAEAIEENGAAMAGILAELIAQGVGETDLQTAAFSVSPRFDYARSTGENRITGFVAQNSLSVRVRDLDRLGEILDAVADLGANQFQGLSFGLADTAQAEDAARANAVAEAKRRAALYADAAGVSLGALMRLSDAETQSRGPMVMMAAERTASSAVPVAAGELTISARVTMIYAIE